MSNALISLVVEIVFAVVSMLLGVLGTWLTIRLEKSAKLENIKTAVESTVDMAKITVGELQQTVVEKMKAAHADNKLTRDEIEALGIMLYDKTVEKMSTPTYQFINSVGVDLTALIKGAGEAWIWKLKKEAGLIPENVA